MELVCPLCNSLQLIHTQCPNCGQTMIDGGALESYLGPYSPYMEKESIVGAEATHCVHLLYCPNCHFDMRTAWELVII
jgi:ribosomal protein L32